MSSRPVSFLDHEAIGEIDLATASPLVEAAHTEMVQGGDLESLLRVLMQFRGCRRPEVLQAAHECRRMAVPSAQAAHWHLVAGTLELAATTGIFPS